VTTVRAGSSCSPLLNSGTRGPVAHLILSPCLDGYYERRTKWRSKGWGAETSSNGKKKRCHVFASIPDRIAELAIATIGEQGTKSHEKAYKASVTVNQGTQPELKFIVMHMACK
jgi:hypothetical protein